VEDLRGGGGRAESAVPDWATELTKSLMVKLANAKF